MPPCFPTRMRRALVARFLTFERIGDTLILKISGSNEKIISEGSTIAQIAGKLPISTSSLDLAVSLRTSWGANRNRCAVRFPASASEAIAQLLSGGQEGGTRAGTVSPPLGGLPLHQHRRPARAQEPRSTPSRMTSVMAAPLCTP